MYILYIHMLYTYIYVQRKLLNLPSTRRGDHVGLCFTGLPDYVSKSHIVISYLIYLTFYCLFLFMFQPLTQLNN